MLTYRMAALIGLIPIIGVGTYLFWPSKELSPQVAAIFLEQNKLAADYAVTAGAIVSYVKNCASMPTAQGKAAELSQAHRSYIVAILDRFAQEGVDSDDVAIVTAKVLDIYMKRSDVVPKTCDDIGLNLYEPEQARLVSLITANLDKIEEFKLRSAVDGVLK